MIDQQIFAWSLLAAGALVSSFGLYFVFRAGQVWEDDNQERPTTQGEKND